MNKLLNSKVILLIIILLASFLRFYQIASTAPTLNWDEAALGYNAYTIGIDGRDEFGNFLPINYLESFGDFKPVVYSYTSVIPVKIFGLNEFGVRFSSAFFGILTVLLTYFLVKEIFFTRKHEKRIEYIALFSSLLLALSPWHIMLSRGAYEANVSTFFIVLGVYLFLKAVNKNMWFLVLAAISLAITFYTFNTARLFVPLLTTVLGIGFWRILLVNKKQTITALIIGTLIILPTVSFLLSPQARIRFSEVNIFTDPKIVEKSNQYVENDNGEYWSRIIHNRRVLYSLSFVQHYFDNLNPSFLFIKGDGNPRFATQDVGQMYLWSLPFLILGTFLLFRRRDGHYWIIPVWLLLGIIPAATARETPHALRIETLLPTLQILVAYGFIGFIYMLKKYRKIVASIFIFLLFINLFYFYHGLLFHYPREYSSEWQYPYRESVKYVVENKDNYDKVVFTKNLGRPYIYFFTYGDLSPDILRKDSDVEREALGFVHVNRLGNILFTNNNFGLTLEENTLYLNVPGKVPEDAKILKTFKLLNGDDALIAYEKE